MTRLDVTVTCAHRGCQQAAMIPLEVRVALPGRYQSRQAVIAEATFAFPAGWMPTGGEPTRLMCPEHAAVGE